MEENPIKIGLTLEQKLGFAFLLVFAMLFLILSFFQMRNNLYRPYALSDAVPSVLIQEKFSDPTEALHYRDTDRDGLTDFEEIYVYGTSAYLEDTDGDGISDRDEISQGKNPLCAEGSACSVQNSANFPNITVDSWIASPNPEDMMFDPQSLLSDPVEIRKLLVDVGMDPESLKDIKDEDLIAIGTEILNSEEFKNVLNNQVVQSTTSTIQTPEEDIFSDPTLLRQKLLETGYVDKTALDKLSDEEVVNAAKQMFDFSE